MNSAVALPLDSADLTISAAGGSLVRRTVLPSGIRVLSERMPGAASASVGFWVAVGSRDEQPATYGSTHFLEHLLFKGTDSRSALDIAVAFDEVGGEHNALTAKEHTCYYAKVRDRDLLMAVSVLADMFANSRIDPEDFETERGVILEELAMADDDPADVAAERFFETVFGDHDLGRPIGGTVSSIRGVTRDEVWHHYRKNYRAQDLVITVAGAVDHDELVAAVEVALTAAGWNLDEEAVPVERRVGSQATIVSGNRLSVTPRTTEQANVFLGVPGFAASADERWPLAVLTNVLGGGMSSRLFQEIRERRGLAYSVHSFASSYSDAGVFGMYAGCTPARLGDVAQLMQAEFMRMADDGITRDELRRAKGQLAGAAALALEDSDARMSRLGRAELTMGEFIDLDESLRRLEQVTVERVLDVARTLAAAPLAIAAVGPVEAASVAPLINASAAA
ncbi:M16 family metallopeptidase [Ruicaihuangia caeni]|uniref:M16 family metallopeptidase n=1 Tax=Ruicaihuangia caeni TaxID=3042517 RepID=UPI00338D53CD